MLFVIAVTVLFVLSPRDHRLVLLDPDTGRTYAGYPMDEGTAFSVSFVHSINKTPYYDLYEIRNGQIWVTGLKYYSFGAGVPEELDPGWQLTLLPDGGMLVTGLDAPLDQIIYRVGTVYDHVLHLADGQEINLTALCGKNSRVELRYR
mgnify:CR=1 FL=1